MITEFKHLLIPGWVAAGKFPDANEDKLRDLAKAWRSISDHSQQAETSVGQEASKLFTTWTGDAATSAQSQVSTVQKWIVSIEASGEVMVRRGVGNDDPGRSTLKTSGGNGKPGGPGECKEVGGRKICGVAAPQAE